MLSVLGYSRFSIAVITRIIHIAWLVAKYFHFQWIHGRFDILTSTKTSVRGKWKLRNKFSVVTEVVTYGTFESKNFHKDSLIRILWISYILHLKMRQMTKVFKTLAQQPLASRSRFQSTVAFSWQDPLNLESRLTEVTHIYVSLTMIEMSLISRTK